MPKYEEFRPAEVFEVGTSFGVDKAFFVSVVFRSAKVQENDAFGGTYQRHAYKTLKATYALCFLFVTKHQKHDNEYSKQAQDALMTCL